VFLVARSVESLCLAHIFALINVTLGLVELNKSVTSARKKEKTVNIPV
jgi:hypothetical protein